MSLTEEGPVGSVEPELLQSAARARLQRLQSNFSLSLLNKIIGSIKTWLVNPFLILCLGPEQFGVWTALASITALDQMMDLGMGNSLVNAVATARGRGQESHLGVLVGRVLRKLFLVSAAAAVFLVLLSLTVEVTSVLVFIDSHDRPAHWALFLILASLVLSTPLSVVEKVEAGYQKYHYIWTCQLLANLASSLAFGVCWWQQWRPGMATIALITLGPAFVARLCNWIVYFGYLAPGLRPSLFHPPTKGDPDWDSVNRSGWLFFYLQCVYLVCFSLDYLIVGNVAGGATVGVFSCVSTYSGAAGILPNLLIQPFWPAYNEAVAGKDYEWCRSAFRRVTALGLLGGLGGCLLLHLLEGVLLRRFAPGIPISQGILLAAYTAVLLEILKFSLNTLLSGLHQLRFLLIIHVLFFVVATPLKVFALKSGDVHFFLWVRTGLAFLLLVVPAAWLAARILKPSPGDGR